MAEDALSAAKGFHDDIGGWDVVSEQDSRLLTVAELPAYDPSESVDSVPTNAHSLVKRAPSPAMALHPSLQFTSGAVERLLATFFASHDLDLGACCVGPGGAIIWPLRAVRNWLEPNLLFHGFPAYALPWLKADGYVLRPQHTLGAGPTRSSLGAFVWGGNSIRAAWRFAPGVDIGHLALGRPSGWFLQCVASYDRDDADVLASVEGVSVAGGNVPIRQLYFYVSRGDSYNGRYLVPHVRDGFSAPIVL